METLRSIMENYQNRRTEHMKVEPSYNEFIKTATKAL